MNHVPSGVLAKYLCPVKFIRQGHGPCQTSVVGHLLCYAFGISLCRTNFWANVLLVPHMCLYSFVAMASIVRAGGRGSQSILGEGGNAQPFDAAPRARGVCPWQNPDATPWCEEYLSRWAPAQLARGSLGTPEATP